MPQILFVDDEPNVLQGLQRMLRPMRQEWEMEFTDGGAQALAKLSERSFDIVVSDMRMPKMDGNQLLTEVMRKHPQVVRIILSGHSDQEVILKSVGVAHQYLSKPCDPETLKTTVARAIALRDLMANTLLKGLVSQMQSLPCLPSLYVELVQELKKSDPSIKVVGEIISKDVAMTAKILQLVNSAFFGVFKRVSSPAEATSLLGLDIVRSLVLSIHVFSQFDQKRVPGMPLEQLWLHSLKVGQYAKQIARAEGQDRRNTDDAFVAGVLHDTGKLILAANFSDLYNQAISRSKEKQESLAALETQLFGASHGEVGAYLLGLWGFSHPLIEAVAFHHHPSHNPYGSFSVLTAVHVANALAHSESLSEELAHPTSSLDAEYIANLKLTDRIPQWQEACK
jgi:HD-like signal output (HDOD) protein